MSNVLGELFGDIAYEIKVKRGDDPETVTYKPAEFAEKINGIDAPEIIENYPVVPDFSNGNQVLAAPDGYVVKSAIYQKPATLTPENVAEGVNIAGIVGSLAAGGGSSADVRYVTFMSDDGTVEYGKLPVATGYDCPNPKFAVTKESTAQYNYDLFGWATTPNGAMDDNALKSVTEDRTVYANFAAILRSYFITFRDEDGSELDKREWTYGSIPSYEPKKDGYDFDGWTPALATVTGEASYTAKWRVQASFAAASWDEIAAAVADGSYVNTFKLGDTKTTILTYDDGTTEEVTWEIVDMDYSNRISNVKIALMPTCVLNNPRTFETTLSGYYLITYSKLGTWLNGDFLNALPADMVNVLTSAELPALSGKKKMHIPSSNMVFGRSYDSATAHNYTFNSGGLGIFDKAKDTGNAIYKDKGGTARQYWTASGYDKYCVVITSAGKMATRNHTESNYVLPLCFI